MDPDELYSNLKLVLQQVRVSQLIVLIKMVTVFTVCLAVHDNPFPSAHLRALECHLPCGITDCYLLLDTGECALLQHHLGLYSIYLSIRD